MAKRNIESPNPKQVLFQDMMLGTLLYSVVLGFFNDYTEILQTRSYSVTFTLAIVMQILTLLTFQLKDLVVERLKKRNLPKQKLILGLSVWLIVFLSKFVFLWVISVLFSEDVYLSGFIGLMIIIVCLSVSQKIVEIVYGKLGK